MGSTVPGTHEQIIPFRPTASEFPALGVLYLITTASFKAHGDVCTSFKLKATRGIPDDRECALARPVLSSALMRRGEKDGLQGGGSPQPSPCAARHPTAGKLMRSPRMPESRQHAGRGRPEVKGARTGCGGGRPCSSNTAPVQSPLCFLTLHFIFLQLPRAALFLENFTIQSRVTEFPEGTSQAARDRRSSGGPCALQDLGAGFAVSRE